jgi:D-amino-acid dehydrogenase
VDQHQHTNTSTHQHRRIGIIGGGIIGLSSAYYLNKAGCDVTIIDQGDMTDGCSFGNAGMIVPSHIIPLAAPGMISMGIRWMFDSTSPFYIKPRLSGDLIKWGYLFYRNSTKENVNRAIPVLREIGLLSKAMYREWAKEFPFDFHYQERGLLMLYKTAEMEKEESETASLANQNGIEAHILSASEVQAMEPDVKVDVRGGVYYPGDAHLTPRVLMNCLQEHLKTLGVRFQKNTEVTDFEIERNSLKSVRTGHGEMEFDEVVVASGSWSGVLCSRFNLSLAMQAGKGYSFSLQNVAKNVRIPSLFLEARVAVTPMSSSLQFGGTMEITGADHSIQMNRVRGIVDSIPDYYPEMKVDLPKKENVWHGLRPCSPDGLPYIGRLSKIKNVVIATGHSMMGLSLGAGTGKLVKEIVMGEKTSMNMGAFDPERFG